MNADDDPSEEAIAGAIRSLGAALHARETGPAVRASILGHLTSAAHLMAGGAPRLRRHEVDAAKTRDNPKYHPPLSAFSGRLNTVAPPMTIRHGALTDGRIALIGAVRLDRRYEGPPGAVHGGIVAGLFDELLGGGQRLNGGPPAVTGKLTVRYRRPTPLDTDLELRTWIADERTQWVIVRGECVTMDSQAEADGHKIVTAEAEAVFLPVDFSRQERA